MTENLLFIQALLAHANRLIELLGDAWPEFYRQLEETRERVARSESDSDVQIAIDDIIASGLASPAAELVRSLLKQASTAAEMESKKIRSVPIPGDIRE